MLSINIVNMKLRQQGTFKFNIVTSETWIYQQTSISFFPLLVSKMLRSLKWRYRIGTCPQATLYLQDVKSAKIIISVAYSYNKI